MSVSVEKIEEHNFIRIHFYVSYNLTTRKSIAFMLNARIYRSNMRKNFSTLQSRSKSAFSAASRISADD
jgi:hypothetical protein